MLMVEVFVHEHPNLERSIMPKLRKLIISLTLAAGLMASPFAMSSASAASTSSWDRVAKCESGGNWKINTHNGYYGGLQISAQTWKSFGGKRYSSQANKTSKKNQIKVAEKIKKGQGWGAWGSCGRKH